LVLNQHHFNAVEHASHSGSPLVSLSIDGKDGGLALVKTVQRDPLKHTPLHLDLQRVSLQEQLHATVSVVLEGEPIGVKEGGMLEIAVHTLHLSCAAGKVPDNVTHDISALKIGDTLKAGALMLPEGCTLLDRPEECVALIRQPIRIEEAVTDTATE
jgi:large subunit ribosomal protein L25